MKKLLASFAAFTALTAAASAADLPRRAAPPVFTPVPVFTWTGFYAGFNAGYGFDAGSNDGGPTVVGVDASRHVFATGAAPAAFRNGVLAFGNSNSSDGFVGGGQIGYNYQFTPGNGVVVGVEADAQYADFGRNRNRFSAFPNGGVAGGVIPGTLVYNPSGISGLDYFGTVRGRIGYAFDRVLFYGTGGFAYGAGGGRQFGSGTSTDDFKTGYAAGGGIEYALPTDSFLNFFRSSAVTFKVEGLYVNLDRGNRNNGAFATSADGVVSAIGGPGVVLVSGGARTRDTEFAVVRAGINYKFGSY
ncbi:outer membrane protein [Methylobacterium brachythecii]|uniref:Membrane protein n=1 Tax=Methylobacterium brachythecii TaxID=1176177 RepID=A0A7W6AE30_9HYPH|nr:porin family protein [Methylobacterium brachythecii]MBB3901003.1 outer membrane immunogenic protein [Methylobacterium brachythecii]GLS45304.1 membrane protein [Methylobacterium brachythecii]